LQNPQFTSPTVAARGLAANQSSGDEKTVLYIVWFAYSIVVVVAVVISFVVLLNCLYLNPRVLPPTGREGWASSCWILVAGYRL